MSRLGGWTAAKDGMAVSAMASGATHHLDQCLRSASHVKASRFGDENRGIDTVPDILPLPACGESPRTAARQGGRSGGGREAFGDRTAVKGGRSSRADVKQLSELRL